MTVPYDRIIIRTAVIRSNLTELQFNLISSLLVLNFTSLHKISNENGVRVVNFTTSKNLIAKSTMLPHRNIHKLICSSPDGKTQYDRPYFDR
jgi:hypothetical protein